MNPDASENLTEQTSSTDSALTDIVPARASGGAGDIDLRIADTLESITEAIFALDSEWCFTYVNAEAERVLFRTRAELLGQSLWEAFPEAADSEFGREYRRAADTKMPVTFEAYFPPLSAWFEVRAFPSLNGISVFFYDITTQVERRQRERFLLELAERARRLTDPEEVIADALRSVGEFLRVSRCVFVDIDIAADICTAQPDYRADSSVVSMAGVFSLSAFGAVVVAAYEAGQSVAVEDVHNDPEQVPVGSIPAYDAVGIRAHASVPVVYSDRLVSCIGVHSSTPRRWKPEEVELLQTVVERTWLTVEVTRQERALEREADERQMTHERTARTLESITDAFYSLDHEWKFTYVNAQGARLFSRMRGELLGQNIWELFPEEVGGTYDCLYHRALSEGKAISVEDYYAPLDAWMNVRVYPSADGLSVFFQNINDRKRNEQALKDSKERYRLLLESTGEGIYGIDLKGRFTFVNPASARMLGCTQDQLIGQNGHMLIHHTKSSGIPYPETECPIYRALRSGAGAYIEDDVFWRTNGTSFPVAYSAAPIWEQGAVLGVVVTFFDISERKALDAERERLALRERNIAAQLQAALTPAIPEQIPGMALTKFYKAALDEAGVGGDFYDVFPIGKGDTALVVGDLSGKGLAAATQVATVRNMLRAFQYRTRSLAEAVRGLNALLAEQGLLTGFATLFIGVFESGAGTFTFVNCGQEPALLKRKSGEIEYLGPTGSVLGSFEGSVFEERKIALKQGDALAIFTDGLTEVGKSRTEMLGAEGVAKLLACAPAAEDEDDADAHAEKLSFSLIQGVDAAAVGGVMRDDVCLLVGVVE